MYLMHIGFDNSARLKRIVYCFEYRGIEFKLIQNNPRKWSDVLLTIVPDNNETAKQAAYDAGAEFLSALAWANNSHVTVFPAGGMGIRDNNLRGAKCRVFDLPHLPFMGNTSGYDLTAIPKIESDIQKKGLTIFREGRSSNKIWLSFLFYWQVLEVNGEDPVVWINDRYSHGQVHVSVDVINRLPLNGRSLGEYLKDDCRHAIAHIRRSSPARTSLRFDVLEENLRFALSADLVASFAKHYILHELGLRKKLFLVRVKGKRFPVYLDESDMRSQVARLAYR